MHLRRDTSLPNGTGMRFETSTTWHADTARATYGTVCPIGDKNRIPINIQAYI